MKFSKVLKLFLPILFSYNLLSFPDIGVVRLFLAEPRNAFWQNENIGFGLLFKDDTQGELRVSLQCNGNEEITLFKKQIKAQKGETFLWELPAYSLESGRYRLIASLDGKAFSSLDITISSSIPVTHFLMGSTAPYEVNAEIGATWAPLDLYNYAKIAGEGNLFPDPLTPSIYESGVNRLISLGLRGFVWQGLWSGYVLHQPFEAGTSFLDPGIESIAMQRAELGAQQARRFLYTIASLGGMDEPGLNYGIVPKGTFAGEAFSLYPDSFLRQAYNKISSHQLPPDPRELPDSDWLSWMRWRANIMGEFFRKAKEHIKKISPSLPWGQDIYASFAINDGTNPFSQRYNDVPTTHSFMFWRGVCEQSWNFALERVGVRDKRFHFASNTTYFTPNEPDEELLAEMVTNYGVMEGVGMLWHLNFRDAKNLKHSFERLRVWGDFILSTIPARHPIAVLYSFTESAMRLKEAGEIPNDEIYHIPRSYALECFALYQAIRRAGFPADIVHEWEVEEGGLKGRKILWMIGIRHPLSQRFQQELSNFINQGGKVFADSTTTWLPPQFPISKINIETSSYVQKIEEIERKGQELMKEGNYTEASKLMRQELSDELLDRYVEILRPLLHSTLGKSEIEIIAKGIIPGKWTGGQGNFYLLLNDAQRAPRSEIRQVEGKEVAVYPASDWEENIGVELSLNDISKGMGVYIVEGKDWSKTRILSVSKGEKFRLNFEPTEMKIIAVLPSKIKKLEMKCQLLRKDGRTIRIEAGCLDENGKRISAPLPLEVKIKEPSGKTRKLYRALNSEGIYRESLPIGTNAPPGKWEIEIRELFSKQTGKILLDIPASPPLQLRPLPDVLVNDEGAIKSLLRSGKKLTIVIGERASAEEKEIADMTTKALKRKGIKVELKEENLVWRKGKYPKVFPALEKRGDKWSDLKIEEREGRRHPWQRLKVWAGENGYPPTLPDAFEVNADLILIGTDGSSKLIQALQRASILPYVANDYFPGRGRGLLEYAWSPFALGRDVILVTGSDPLGVKKSSNLLISLTK